MEKHIQIENIATGNWTPQDAEKIYNILEKPNWAPWLEASKESIEGRSIVFPQGQLVIKSIDGTPIASLSTNQIYWDGKVEALPTWDDVAGDPTTYEKTYHPNGNALVMMSMNVHPEHQRRRTGKNFDCKDKTICPVYRN